MITATEKEICGALEGVEYLDDNKKKQVYKGQQRKGESRQQFLYRTVKATNAAPEDVWDALSNNARGWYDSAVDAYKAQHPLPEFSLMEGPAVEDIDGHEHDTDEAPEEIEVAPNSGNGHDHGVTVIDTDEEDEDEPSPKTRKRTKVAVDGVPKAKYIPRLYEIMIADLTLDKHKLFDKLKAEGHQPHRSTVISARKHFVRTVKWLKENGLLK